MAGDVITLLGSRTDEPVASEKFKAKWNGIGKRPVQVSNARSPISRNERERKRKARKLANASRKRNRV
jgi:hypothetical protein